MTLTRSHQSKVFDGEPVQPRDVPTLVVDDHATFRDTLRDLVAAAPGFVQVGEACSGEEAVGAVDRLLPQLVLMDVVMPGEIDGIAASRMILNRHPELMVVLISVDDPALYPDVAALGGAVASVRKQDLRPAGLLELWEGFRNFDPGAASSSE